MMIAAVIPAAGLSTRMGGSLPKPLLPWGQHTVIEQVVLTLQAAGLQEIVVVSGFARDLVEAALARYPVRCLFNPGYRQGEMLSSIQAGLLALPAACDGALLALADQPQVQKGVVRQIMDSFSASGGTALIVPSFRNRRGHPIILPRRLWPAVLSLAPGDTLRTVIHRHAGEIHHVVVDSPTVLADLDTPDQYRQALQRSE